MTGHRAAGWQLWNFFSELRPMSRFLSWYFPAWERSRTRLVSFLRQVEACVSQINHGYSKWMGLKSQSRTESGDSLRETPFPLAYQPLKSLEFKKLNGTSWNVNLTIYSGIHVALLNGLVVHWRHSANNRFDFDFVNFPVTRNRRVKEIPQVQRSTYWKMRRGYILKTR